MRCVFRFLMALALFAFAACEGRGVDCAGPATEFTGEWEITSTVASDNRDGRMAQTFPMIIAQDATALTAETSDLDFSGTIGGNQIQMSGSFPEDGGTATVNATLTASVDGDSMQGTTTPPSPKFACVARDSQGGGGSCVT